MYERDYKPGEKIFSQGGEGDEFFVILSGEAEVHVDKENEEPAKFLLHGGDLKLKGSISKPFSDFSASLF